MSITVECKNGDWITDIELHDPDTLPATCPKCGGKIMVSSADSGVPLYGEDGEINPEIYDD